LLLGAVFRRRTVGRAAWGAVAWISLSDGSFSGPFPSLFLLFDGFWVDVRGVGNLRRGAHMDFQDIAAGPRKRKSAAPFDEESRGLPL
jgi:hypothetical protein